MSIALASVALFVHCRQYPTYHLNLTGELCQWVTAIVFLYALVDRLDESKTFVRGRDEWIFDFVLTAMFPVALLVLCLLLIRRNVKWVFDLCCRCCKVTSRESNWERYSAHVAELDVEAQAVTEQPALSADTESVSGAPPRGAEEQSKRPDPDKGGLRSLVKSAPTSVKRQGPVKGQSKRLSQPKGGGTFEPDKDESVEVGDKFIEVI